MVALCLQLDKDRGGALVMERLAPLRDYWPPLPAALERRHDINSLWRG